MFWTVLLIIVGIFTLVNFIKLDDAGILLRNAMIGSHVIVWVFCFFALLDNGLAWELLLTTEVFAIAGGVLFFNFLGVIDWMSDHADDVIDGVFAAPTETRIAHAPRRRWFQREKIYYGEVVDEGIPLEAQNPSNSKRLYAPNAGPIHPDEQAAWDRMCDAGEVRS